MTEEQIQKKREYNRARYYEKREEILARIKKNYQERPGFHRAKARNFYRSHKEKCLEDARRWQEANREKVVAAKKKWRASNPEKQRQATRRWAEDHPEKLRERANRHRARKVNARGTVTSEQLAMRVSFYGGICAYCRNAPYQAIDHVIPLSRGGTNWPANLRPACDYCNTSKGAKLLSEWNRTK